MLFILCVNDYVQVCMEMQIQDTKQKPALSSV